MDLGLKGQVAVVVGGASGIGLAIARAFAAEGASVALLDRNPSVADAAGQLGATYGVSAHATVVDITDYAAVVQAAQDFEAQPGPVEHVVCTAAIGSGKGGFPFWNLSPSDWQSVLQVNIMGTVNTVHAFAKAMIERRRGTFLLLGSVAGQIGSQTDPPYSATKAALINFTQCAAKDLAPYNIRANILNPGMVNTPLQHSVYQSVTRNLPEHERPDFDAWAVQKIKHLVPLNRWQEPKDLAEMAVFLASDRARHVTGQSINVDGGWVMHW